MRFPKRFRRQLLRTTENEPGQLRRGLIETVEQFHIFRAQALSERRETI